MPAFVPAADPAGVQTGASVYFELHKPDPAGKQELADG
jgi:hypothetical protein